ncbi:MAG TPA: hypothetical protein VKA55_05345 [Gammaproteobacteria bacterium]|nr:hypothetical protein [Gammaproteobacteria bacterium]
MTPFDKQRAADWDYLSGLIGRRAEYAGEPYTVIELLPDGPQLVLQHARQKSIQDDLQGRAYRRVPYTECLPVLDADGSPSDLLDLLLLDEGAPAS